MPWRHEHGCDGLDTLKPAGRLAEAGFTTAQAAAPAAAIADTFRKDPATRRDAKESETAPRHGIEDGETALRHALKDVETGLRHDLTASETRLDHRIAATETALRAEPQSLRAEFKADLRDLEHRMTIRLGSMPAAAIVLAGAKVTRL